MTPQVAALWRHPIKGHGREALDRVELFEGQTMPWDRRWAVAHEMARTDGTEWTPCTEFSRGSKVAALMAIDAKADEAENSVTLSHPKRPDLTFNPDGDINAFLDWVRPLMPENRAQSARIVRVEGRGMTDSDYPSISLINLQSHADLSEKMGLDLSVLRWRCNIHMTGIQAWEEMEWVGKTVQIGSAELSIREPIERCMATVANPKTGERDADTLGTLNTNYGHQDFGIYGIVTKSGEVAVGDAIRLL